MQKSYSIVAAVIAIAIILLGAWYFMLRPLITNNQNTASQNQQAVPTTAGLGSQIYQQTQNPLQKKLPDTNPIKNANPLNGAYTNPF